MKKTTLTVATAPKTSTFQMRINPEIKAQVEGIYAQCGMTLTDAINAFIQQSINVEEGGQGCSGSRRYHQQILSRRQKT